MIWFKLAPGIDYENVKDQLEDAGLRINNYYPHYDQTSHLLLGEQKALKPYPLLPIIFWLFCYFYIT